MGKGYDREVIYVNNSKGLVKSIVGVEVRGVEVRGVEVIRVKVIGVELK